MSKLLPVSIETSLYWYFEANVTLLGVLASISPQAYLGWLLISQEKLQLPLGILFKCAQSLIRWHGLGLSL